MAEKPEYYDKNGELIERGMTIQHDDGDKERVYETIDGDLGLNASNESWLERHGGNRELYPLYQFDTRKEWTIVKA